MQMLMLPKYVHMKVKRTIYAKNTDTNSFCEIFSLIKDAFIVIAFLIPCTFSSYI